MKRQTTMRRGYLVFLISFLFWGGNLGAAHSLQAEPSREILSIEHLAVPESLGKVEGRFAAKSLRWIIHIQDVHAHFTAQENIAAILDHLNAVYGIETVAVEGGWNSTSYPESWGIPSSASKQMLARDLLEEGYLSGPAFAALFTQTPLLLVGIEEEALYEANRDIYLKHLAKRAEIHQKVEALRQKIEGQKNNTFNSDLRRFDTFLLAFREGAKTEEVAGFLPFLFGEAARLGIRLDDLEQMVIFQKVTAIGGVIDKNKLKAEAGRLMEGYRRERLSFDELLKSGKIPEDRLEHYPATRKYLELLTIQDQIAYRAFMGEKEELIGHVKEKLFASEEERVLDQKGERFYLAKKIILFQATPDDLPDYEKEASPIEAEMEAAGLGEALRLGLDFYKIAKKRDEIFFQKLTSDSRLQGDVAVVTGGFHTAGLTEQFEEAGISYLVITPDLGDDPTPDRELYFNLLRQELPSRQTLAPPGTSDPRKDKAFKEGLQILLRTNDLRKAREAVSTYQEARAVEGTVEPVSTAPFEEMTPEEQGNLVASYRETMRDGTRPLFLLIRASVLDRLLNPKDVTDPESVRKAELARTIWEVEILANRANTVGLIKDQEDLYKEIYFQSLLQPAEIKPVLPQLPVEKVVENERRRKGENLLVAMLDPDYEGRGELLVLNPLEPELEPALLLLLRPLLEFQGPGQRIDPSNPQTLARIRNILFEMYAEEGILRAA